MFTIDASVWVNADSPAEAEHASSRTLLDMLFAGRTRIAEPTLLSVELAAAISRTRGDADLAREMTAALLALPSIVWVTLDQPLAAHAAELAARYRLRGADAIYAAVALALDCTLVSLDREHLTRLRPIVRTLTPVEAIAQLKGSTSRKD